MDLPGCTTRPASGKRISAGRKDRFFFPLFNKFVGSSEKGKINRKKMYKGKKNL